MNSQHLELGDIIQIESDDLLGRIYYITYIDLDQITLVDIDNYTVHILKSLDDIKKIVLLNRSVLKGYAKQNGLVQFAWIDIVFGLDIERNYTAQITNVIEDMIELTTYPEQGVFYIDFAYKGLPKDIPIKKICIRPKPITFISHIPEDLMGDGTGTGTSTSEGEGSMEYTSDGYIEIQLPTSYVVEENYKEQLQKKYNQTNEIIYGKQLAEIYQRVEVPIEMQKWGLDAQINDMLDTMLADIPEHKRTHTVMNNINTFIQRFCDIRDKYNIVDENGYVTGHIKHDSQPLIKKLENLSVSLPWIKPVVSEKRKIYGDYDSTIIDAIEVNQKEELDNEQKTKNAVYSNNGTSNVYKYADCFIKTNIYNQPFTSFPEIGIHTLNHIESNIDVLVSSTQHDIFKSSGYKSTIKNDLILTKEQSFVVNRLNTEIKYPYKINKKSKDNSLFATLMPSDIVSIRSLVLLPISAIEYSKVNTQYTNILDKSVLSEHYRSYFNILNKNGVIKKKVVKYNGEPITNYYDKNNAHQYDTNFLPTIGYIQSPHFCKVHFLWQHAFYRTPLSTLHSNPILFYDPRLDES